MLRHIVLLQFSASQSSGEIDRVLKGFADLRARIPGILSVSSGPNVSPENLDKGFKHGFVIDFDSPDARDAYLVHPDHVAFAEQTVLPALENGRESITVFDYEL